MKRIFGIALLSMLLIFPLAACSGGSHVITNGEINVESNRMTGEYSSFSGKHFKNVTVKEGETLSILFNAETQGGTVNAVIMDSDKNTIKTLEPGTTASLNEPGKYRLQVEASKHKGNFNLVWKKERQ